MLDFQGHLQCLPPPHARKCFPSRVRSLAPLPCSPLCSTHSSGYALINIHRVLTFSLSPTVLCFASPTSLAPLYAHPTRSAQRYDFLYRPEELPVALERENHKVYAPVVSFYVSPNFADLPFPESTDWEAATGKVFPPSFIADGKGGPKKPRDMFTKINFDKFTTKFTWAQKSATALFRGTATGGGVTPETNQRLNLAWRSKQWERDAVKGGSVPFLDCKITGWNFRDKKVSGSPMVFINRKRLEGAPYEITGGKHNYIPMYDQAKYKYLVYVEGHCAANRYSYMMRLGSVILKVESQCEAHAMWYYPLLRPFVDHVPVKADLSDLAEQIQWLRDNDGEAQEIAANANRLYERYLSRDGVLDYLQLLTTEVARRFYRHPSWYSRPTDPPQSETQVAAPASFGANTAQHFCFFNRNTSEGETCVRCQEDEKQAREMRREAQLEAHETQQAKRRKQGGDGGGGSGRKPAKVKGKSVGTFTFNASKMGGALSKRTAKS